jgi:hypothetical protein
MAIAGSPGAAGALDEGAGSLGAGIVAAAGVRSPPGLPLPRDPTSCRHVVVDEETAEAIRRAWEGGGEPAGVVELRRHFPLITDNAQARLCVRAIVGWGSRAAPDQEPE